MLLLVIFSTRLERAILCLSSSKILTPHPPLRPARQVCTLPPSLVRGEDTRAGWRGGWGVNIWKDARHRIGLLQYSIISLRSLGLILIIPAPSKRFDTCLKFRGKSLIFPVQSNCDQGYQELFPTP